VLTTIQCAENSPTLRAIRPKSNNEAGLEIFYFKKYLRPRRRNIKSQIANRSLNFARHIQFDFSEFKTSIQLFQLQKLLHGKTRQEHLLSNINSFDKDYFTSLASFPF